MTRTRWSTALGGLAAAALVFAPATISSAAPGDAQLTIVHGLGPAPNAVDVYVDGSLVEADFQYGEQFLAELPGGTYTVEVCAASVAPPDPLPPTGCEESANFPNGGVDITVANNTSYTVMAQFAGSGPATGRPTIVAYPTDLSCAESGEGRIAFIHAATAPDVDVLFDDEVVFDDVAPEASPPPSFDDVGQAAADIAMVIEDTGGTDILSDITITQTPAGYNYTLIFVGNPQQDAEYDLLDVNYPLDTCPPPPTTTVPTTPPTTAPPAVPPVQVTPRFTG